ncbi:MAG: ATP-binding protein [Alphaproteobacteria bacterium]
MNPIKSYLPKSLFGRSLLIIILPVALMQIVVAYIFFNAHWATVTANLSNGVASDVAVTVELYKQAPSLERAERLDRMIRPKMELSVALDEGDKLPTSTRKAFFSVLDKTVQRALIESLDDPFWFDTTRYPNHIDIRVAVDEGVLRFIAARERVFAPTGYVFIFWLVTATVLLTLVSILFIRNQARPISRLADAADAFGKGQDISDYKPSGASEVRLAGHSFLKMRHRIKRHIEQRITLLAGVSHDLRTPLTRLNLHMAMQDDTKENRAARKDLKDMENMLEGYLNFARGQAGELSEPVLMSEFLISIIDRLPAPKPKLVISEDGTASIKPIGLNRAVQNLISNAKKYGKSVKVTLHCGDAASEIWVEDDGPGIAAESREDAFKPFHRLDEARNQNIDGVGLGLSISRDIAQGHGGTLTLDVSDMGGLKAVIRLPV